MVAQGEVADSFVLPIPGCRMSGEWSAAVTQFIIGAFHLPNTTAEANVGVRVAAISTPARQTVPNDTQQGLERVAGGTWSAAVGRQTQHAMIVNANRQQP
jgi:hypothetical protein